MLSGVPLPCPGDRASSARQLVRGTPSLMDLRNSGPQMTISGSLFLCFQVWRLHKRHERGQRALECPFDEITHGALCRTMRGVGCSRQRPADGVCMLGVGAHPAWVTSRHLGPRQEEARGCGCRDAGRNVSRRGGNCAHEFCCQKL